MRALLFLALLAAAPAPPTRPLAVSLPSSEAFFADRADAPADAMNGNCLGCHSAAMVTNQPALTAAQWRETVAKMKTVYKAPIEPADEAAILAWLTAKDP